MLRKGVDHARAEPDTRLCAAKLNKLSKKIVPSSIYLSRVKRSLIKTTLTIRLPCSKDLHIVAVVSIQGRLASKSQRALQQLLHLVNWDSNKEAKHPSKLMAYSRIRSPSLN